jgi:glycosyltransferase involved in cell wall biosynthesis
VGDYCLKFVLVNWYFAHEGIIGGCESFHEKLAVALRRAGHEVDFVSYKKAAEEANINLPFHRLRYPEAQASILIDQFLERHYSRNDHDLMLIRDAGVGGLIDVGLPEIDVFGNPYYTLYDRLRNLGKIDKFAYIDKHDFSTCLEKMTATNALQNVALSNFMATVEMPSLGIRCDRVINNAVDIEQFKPQEKKPLRRKFGFATKDVVGCWVGSWTAVKGIEIINQLTSKFREIKWVLVLKHNFTGSLMIPSEATTAERKLRALFLKFFKQSGYAYKRGNIRILCQLQPQVLAEIYSLSDFAVLPYLCEGNSHVVLEACASNLPLVTTQTGLFWDFWNEKIGYRMSDTQNIDEYASAIDRLLEDSPVFQPRNVILDQHLDLETWERKWIDYLTDIPRQ